MIVITDLFRVVFCLDTSPNSPCGFFSIFIIIVKKQTLGTILAAMYLEEYVQNVEDTPYSKATGSLMLLYLVDKQRV